MKSPFRDREIQRTSLRMRTMHTRMSVPFSRVTSLSVSSSSMNLMLERSKCVATSSGCWSLVGNSTTDLGPSSTTDSSTTNVCPSSPERDEHPHKSILRMNFDIFSRRPRWISTYFYKSVFFFMMILSFMMTKFSGF